VIRGDLRAVDLEPDGDLDIVFVDFQAVTILQQEDDGSLADPVVVHLAEAVGTVLADVTGDGRLDAVLTDVTGCSE
jgi:hypothetical protein